MSNTISIEKNAVEELVCKAIEEAPKFPMSQELSNMFISMTMNSKDEKGLDLLYQQLFKRSWLLNVIKKRIDVCLKVEIDKAVQFFLLFLGKNPGNCIMYLYYLQYYAKKKGIEKISFEQFGMDVFPNGYPSKEILSQIWDSQKSGIATNGNIIDLPSAAESIM